MTQPLSGLPGSGATSVDPTLTATHTGAPTLTPTTNPRVLASAKGTSVVSAGSIGSTPVPSTRKLSTDPEEETSAVKASVSAQAKGDPAALKKAGEGKKPGFFKRLRANMNAFSIAIHILVGLAGVALLLAAPFFPPLAIIGAVVIGMTVASLGINLASAGDKEKKPKAGAEEPEAAAAPGATTPTAAEKAKPKDPEVIEKDIRAKEKGIDDKRSEISDINKKIDERQAKLEKLLLKKGDVSADEVDEKALDKFTNLKEEIKQLEEQKAELMAEVNQELGAIRDLEKDNAALKKEKVLENDIKEIDGKIGRLNFVIEAKKNRFKKDGMKYQPGGVDPRLDTELQQLKDLEKQKDNLKARLDELKNKSSTTTTSKSTASIPEDDDDEFYSTEEPEEELLDLQAILTDDDSFEEPDSIPPKEEKEPI